ncbi:MAG: penicillin-binding transpeptidase domain-containing protein [Defluviitaleaceae bacterium]|nr:penicillin-binding transpeptidase domain-containing protein [Defluviitaleaceae bacterium]
MRKSNQNGHDISRRSSEFPILRKPRKNLFTKRKIFLLLFLVGITSIGIIGFTLRPSSFEGTFAALATTEPIPPDELLRQYFEHIENRRFEDMYNLLTELSQADISREDFIERNRNIYDGIDARNITFAITQILDVVERPGRKIIVYNLLMDTVAGETAQENHQAIIELNADNQYRIQWSSRMIFPELGNNDRVRVSILPAQRGRILDRHGAFLAGPGTASAVGFIPGRMRREEIPAPNIPLINAEIDLEDDVDEMDIEILPSTFIYNEEDITKVAELLEMTPEAVMRRLNASYVKDDIFVQLRIISKDAQELIDELLTVQGIMISTAYVRYYPLGRRAAHLVGYVQNINAEELEALRGEGYHMNSIIGKSGLERIYEDILRARDGRDIFIIDSEGNRTATIAYVPPINGSDIRLTIDSQIQNQLYDSFNEDKSASVAMNPITGEVLALASTPAYDPNDFVRGMTTSVWTALNEDENLPLFNRFRATFSPGSTMKALTAAIGIDTESFRYDEDFGPSGRSWQRDESWGRFFVTTVRTYDGPANLNNAMAWSDNIYFAKAALRIGTEAFSDRLKGLGFSERIPFEYGLFSSTISRTGEIASEIQLADSGYGQGQILMNPIHMAAIYAAFVNDGNVIEPRLIYDRDNEPQFWLPQAISPETARIVLDSLINTVDYGTGRNARISGITLAGKTGTAEIKLAQDDKDGTELGWFVLFTADEDESNPLLVISIVEDVHGRGGSGYVVPRVKQVFE